MIRDIVWGIRWGVALGGILGGFTMAIILLAGELPSSLSVSLPQLLVLYPLTGGLTGGIIGVFRKRLTTRARVMVAVSIAMFPTTTAFGAVSAGPISNWGVQEWMGMIFGATVLGYIGTSVFYTDTRGNPAGSDPHA